MKSRKSRLVDRADVGKENPGKGPRLAQIEQGFQAAVERDAGGTFKNAVAVLNKGYANALDAAILTATKAAQLDEVLVLKAEQAALATSPA